MDQIEIDFSPGLTVLTGETGSGKSVIIGGLLMTLGGRSDKELVRHGTKKTIAESIFSLPSKSKVKQALPGPGRTTARALVSLTREVTSGGNSKAFIDTKQASLAKVRELASVLCDLNTQQGQRNLLNSEKHILFLDSFAGLNTQVEKLKELFNDFASLEKELADSRKNASALREKLELIRFQIDELTKADIEPGEESALDDERKRLESVQTLMETGQTIVHTLTESDTSINTALSHIDNKLQCAANIDKQLKDDAGLLSESVINLNELSQNIQSYLSRLESNPQRLEVINERLSELYHLRKKYNTDENGLAEKLKELSKQSLGSADINSHIQALKGNLQKARDEYFTIAKQISQKRHKTAGNLQKKLKKELADLAIDQAEFTINFITEFDESGFELDGQKVRALPSGLETIEFLLATNPNEPVRPLVKIASGGEISRIMLALLTVIAGKYKFPTIVFDEIDTGIGGQTAIKLGQKLKQLSQKHQIITISHLPAVASQADHHLVVRKHRQGKRNVISIDQLTGKEIKKELDRMTAFSV
ncbi:MAG: DNA repair protein RecN [candidate division Zixibacteria bacterium]|nr:DNA repair protein RecN [candidate division Zixibacteria bacterium]